MTKKPMTLLRSHDHEIMAKRVEAIVAASGALCVRRLVDLSKPGCIALQITAPGGLRVNLSLNGEHGRPRALYFLHWTMESDSRNRLCPGFGGVNAYDFCKATQVAYSFEALCEQLELSLRLAATGEAYQAVRQPVRQLAQVL